MDAFGDDDFNASATSAVSAEVDPAAEFLAREQDQLAGLEDEDLIPAPQSVSADPVQGTLVIHRLVIEFLLVHSSRSLTPPPPR